VDRPAGKAGTDLLSVPLSTARRSRPTAPGLRGYLTTLLWLWRETDRDALCSSDVTLIAAACHVQTSSDLPANRDALSHQGPIRTWKRLFVETNAWLQTADSGQILQQLRPETMGIHNLLALVQESSAPHTTAASSHKSSP
jgi:hypothetical protein